MKGPVFSDNNLNNEIKKYSRFKTIEKDIVIMLPGDKVHFLPIVKEGVLRIVRQNEEGKEIFLYHLYPGETCALSLIACMENRNSIIKVITERDLELLLLPGNMVNDWLRFQEWKSFVNNTYSARFLELIEVIDLIAFHNMDRQVLHYLEERARASNTRILSITHQEIAEEFHTHREAISRLLRNMEQKKILSLGRNTIELSPA